MATSFQFLHIVSDLIADPALRQQFNANPVAVMDQYGLTTDEKLTLLTMDRPTVKGAVDAPALKAAVDGFALGAAEFPPCSEEYMPDLGLGALLYPNPTPTIHRLRPQKLRKSDLVQPVFEIIVTGQSFSRSAGAGLQNAIIRVTQRDPPHKVLDVSSTLFGTFRCSRLRGLVSSDTAFVPGKYQVQVVNHPGTARETILSLPEAHDLVIE